MNHLCYKYNEFSPLMLKKFMANSQCGNYPTNQATPAAYEKSVPKLSFQNALALRYHDSNVD